MNKYDFPEGFLWGAATSAHQIEGGNINDWSEWENSEKRMAELKKDGKDTADYISGLACDSYCRYEEDLDIAKSLNHNIHRISLEWSRIEPEDGRFDHDAIRHYKDVVKAIRERGMEPMITLWHFTNPIWFTEQGGFLNEDAVSRFVRFVGFVVDNLKDDVNLWITFNEATSIYSGMAFLRGVWPPQCKSVRAYLKVIKNFAIAHRQAYEEIKKIYSQSPVRHILTNVSPDGDAPTGMSHNINTVRIGLTENNAQIICPWYLRMFGIGKLVDFYRNHYLFSSCRGYYDFIGLNYYNILRLPGSYAVLSKQAVVNEMGWEIYPKGLRHQLNALRKYNKPIYITENGIADSTDARRSKFITDHLYETWLAIRDGVDVRGYLYWSLLDNFEWHHGYAPRFGLIEVDFNNNQSRKVRRSAREYAKICISNQLEI
jgi:beta-glucosidase